jgi:hypothetical protein
MPLPRVLEDPAHRADACLLLDRAVFVAHVVYRAWRGGTGRSWSWVRVRSGVGLGRANQVAPPSPRRVREAPVMGVYALIGPVNADGPFAAGTDGAQLGIKALVKWG